MDNKLIILIVIIFVGIIGYMYMTTPYLEVENFIVEKHTETINYASGNVEKNIVITSNFTIIQGHANRLGVKGNYILYDKNDNVLDNSTFEQSDAPYEFSYYWDDLEDANKVKKIELIIYNYENGVELYHNNTTHIQKGADTNDEVDDTIDWSSHKSSSSSSKNNHDSYSTNDDYSVYGDYIGNSNTHKFHQSFCSWADNIKSGNRVSFSSRQDALDRGYSPCSYCNP